METDKTYKLIVISDTHGNVSGLRRLLGEMNAADFVVHLGDVNADILFLQEKIGTRLVCVRGNCDVVSPYSVETVLIVGKTRFFITHGHTYGVKSSLLRLQQKTVSEKCDYAFYGHTHQAAITPTGNTTLLNPGALSGSKPTYAVLRGNGDIFNAQICLL